MTGISWRRYRLRSSPKGFARDYILMANLPLKALAANPADLGIFDIKMPRMDGLELLKRLREKVQMPVIFLTSKDDEIDEELGFASGADDYVAKPFSQRHRTRFAVLRRAETDEMPSLKTYPAERRRWCGGGWKWMGCAQGALGREGCFTDRHRIHDPRSTCARIVPMWSKAGTS